MACQDHTMPVYTSVSIYIVSFDCYVLIVFVLYYSSIMMIWIILLMHMSWA